MTAPFAPPPNRRQLLFLVIVCAFAVAVPFARREDWIGRVAFLIIAVCAIGLWGLLIYGVVRTTIENRKDQSSSD